MKHLLADLQDDNEFFDMVVNMIPSKLYIAGQSGDDYNPKNPYYKNSGSNSAEARKTAAKAAKRKKFDPSQATSTTEKKSELDHAESSELPTPLQQQPTDSLDRNASRIEALREKLHKQLEIKRNKRPTDPDQVSKRAARRQIKEQRRREAAERKKMAKTEVQTQAVQYHDSSADDPVSDLKNLDFGLIQGLNETSLSDYAAANKALANLGKRKNLQKTLEDAIAKKRKLDELKRGSQEEKEKAESMIWSDTLKEASGERVRSDPSKIAKKIKRKEAAKKKSQKAWKARTDQATDSKKKRQKIRQHNLGARKKGGSAGANLSRKEIRDDDGKPKSRVGFEGRKQQFLNKPKGK